MPATRCRCKRSRGRCQLECASDVRACAEILYGTKKSGMFQYDTKATVNLKTVQGVVRCGSAPLRAAAGDKPSLACALQRGGRSLAPTLQFVACRRAR